MECTKEITKLFAEYQTLVFDKLEKDCVLEADIIFSVFMGEYAQSDSTVVRLCYALSQEVEETRLVLGLARASLIERHGLKYEVYHPDYASWRENIITHPDYDSCPDRMKKLIEKIHERHLTETDDLT